MPIFRKKDKKPVLVLASRQADVFPLLPTDTFFIREAFSTRGVVDSLESNPSIIIVSYADLLELPDFPVATLKASLEAVQDDGIAVVTPSQYVADHEQLISTALLNRNPKTAVRFLPHRSVLVANYAGGVGKTTLSMAAAKRFREASGLGTALVELGIGGSAIRARAGQDLVSLYDVVTDDASPGVWEGVDIYPLDGRELHVLADGDRERTVETLKTIQAEHTLTIFDASPANPLWAWLIGLVSDVIVITAPRQDSIAQTESMIADLRDALAASTSPPRLHLVLNMSRGIGDRISLAGDAEVTLPHNPRKAERYDRTLADPILNMLYEGWANRKKRDSK